MESKFLILTDLVRSQNDQLLQIRRQLDETMFRNDLLLDELEKVRDELKSQIFQSQELLPVSPAEYQPQSTQAFDMPSIIESHEGSVESVVAAESDVSPNSNFVNELGTVPLMAFCSKGSPFKYLSMARKDFKNSSGTKASISLLPVGPTMTFDDESRSEGTFVKPEHHFDTDSAGQLQKVEYEKGKWIKHPMNKAELIWTNGPNTFYLGTYEKILARFLSAAEFSELSDKMKKEIYALSFTGGGNRPKDLNMRSMYATGELQAIEIRCRRLGFNEEFNRCIFKAAGLPYVSLQPADTNATDGSRPLTVIEAPVDNIQPNISPRAYQLNSLTNTTLHRAQKEGFIKGLKLHIKHEEFVFDPYDSSHGYQVIAKQRLGSMKRGFPITHPTVEHQMVRYQEIIVCQGEQYYHLGTYKPVSLRTLEVSEFEKLSPQIKERLYQATVMGGDEKATAARAVLDIEGNYASGVFKAARLDFERVGLNADVQSFLEHLSSATSQG